MREIENTSPDAPKSQDPLGSLTLEDLRFFTASLRRYAMALTGHATDADDLVQEALKNVLVHIRKGKEIKDLRAYMFSALHNLWCNEVTRRRKSTAMEPELSETGLDCRGTQDLRVECIETEAALRRLPDEFRCVVLLVGLEGYSYRAVSDMLGIPIGTVMSRLHRGREALRSMMSEQSAERVKRVR